MVLDIVSHASRPLSLLLASRMEQQQHNNISLVCTGAKYVKQFFVKFFRDEKKLRNFLSSTDC
jgi:hypothetical protein